MDNHEKILELISEKDEITWQRVLYELVKSEEMDPWDIDISALTKKYIEIVKKLKDPDFRVSGKVLLAAAILLKIKSTKLLNEDLSDLDRLLIESEEQLPDELDLEDAPVHREDGEKVPLIPRTPQPRKRKVSIYDLVDALEKALEVKQRRVLNSIPSRGVQIPKKTRDITEVIREVYSKIKMFFYKNNKNRVIFSQLVPNSKKEDKVFTFIPLLHLTTQRKINIEQQEHFGEIEIMLNSKKDINKELESEA